MVIFLKSIHRKRRDLKLARQEQEIGVLQQLETMIF